jgi:Outer membrane cobalamin receptor protein
MNKMKKKFLCAGLCGALTVCLTPMASAADEDFTLDEYVVTANRIPVAENEVAANVTVITQKDLERGSYTAVSDALRDNNVNVGKMGFASVPMLNGDSRVLVLLNGRKMNWSHLVVSGDDNALNIDSLPIKNIERIEIVRGPNSALYGSDAVGGVINIITKKPSKQETTVSTEAGTWNAHRYALSTEGSDEKSGVSYLFTYDKQKRGNYTYNNAHTGNNIEFPNSSLDQEYETLRVDKDLKGDTLSFELERRKSHNGFGIYLTDYDKGTAYGSGMYTDENDLNMALTYTWKDPNTTSVAGNYLRLYRNQAKADSPFAGTPYEHTLTLTGMQWQKNWKLGEKHSLLGGLEAETEKIDETNDGVAFAKDASTEALYLEDHWKMDDAWSVNFGSRYENHSDFDGDLTSHVSVNKVLSPKTNAYLSWGQAVNNPTLKQRYANSPYWLGNPNLKQEKSQTITLGFVSKMDATTTLQGSVYRSDLDNAIDWKWNTDIARTVYYNVNKEKRQGLDLTLNKKLSKQWSVDAGYSYSHVEKKSTDSGYEDYIYNSRPNGYSLGVHYNQDKWLADLKAIAVSGRDTTAYTDNSFTTLDLNLSYQADALTKIYLKGYNLTNEAYELVNYINHDAGAYAMPGRSFMFGIERKF